MAEEEVVQRIVSGAVSFMSHGAARGGEPGTEDFSRADLIERIHVAVVEQAMEQGLSIEKDAEEIVRRKSFATGMALDLLDKAEQEAIAKLADELAKKK